ncbi:MAG: hypothetical protein IPK99_17800 [Flavobacteriales bacterium]|nr:hypothetical protein [Flavobacteriales bacterium]
MALEARARHLGLCPFHNEKTPSFNVSPQLRHLQGASGCGEERRCDRFPAQA